MISDKREGRREAKRNGRVEEQQVLPEQKSPVCVPLIM